METGNIKQTGEKVYSQKQDDTEKEKCINKDHEDSKEKLPEIVCKENQTQKDTEEENGINKDHEDSKEKLPKPVCTENQIQKDTEEENGINKTCKGEEATYIDTTTQASCSGYNADYEELDRPVPYAEDYRDINDLKRASSIDYQDLSKQDISNTQDYQNPNNLKNSTDEIISDRSISTENQVEYLEVIHDTSGHPQNQPSSDHEETKRKHKPFNRDDPQDNPARFHPDFRRTELLSKEVKYTLGIILGLLAILAIVIGVVFGRKEDNVTNTILTSTASPPQPEWEGWSSWRECDTGCDGQKKRTRICIGAVNLRHACEGPRMEMEKCGPCERIKPVLKLDLRTVNTNMRKIEYVLPLSDSESVISNFKGSKSYIKRLDTTGATINTLAVINQQIRGLVDTSPSVTVLLKKEVIELKREGGEVRRYKVPVAELNDGIQTEKGLVLVDGGILGGSGTVFMFDAYQQKKDVKVRWLNRPTAISQATTDKGILYAVCERSKSRISLYNGAWQLVRHIGKQVKTIGRSNADGTMNEPESVVFLPYPPHNLLVIDKGNSRISEFNINGNFVQQLFRNVAATDIKVFKKHLWVVYHLRFRGTKVHKYQVYK